MIRRTYHGGSKTPEYRLWAGMKERCLNSKSKAWANYGGRGIRICERWANSFSAFIEDIGYRPSPNHTIDRVNNDGNYEPGNVRWATPKEQARNRRDNRLITIDGVTKCAIDWARERGIPTGTVFGLLCTGHAVEFALTPLPNSLTCEHCRISFKPRVRCQRFCSNCSKNQDVHNQHRKGIRKRELQTRSKNLFSTPSTN